MGFGIIEKLGHVVEDSAQKEKGRVEVDAIRDRQKCIYRQHTFKYCKLSSFMLRLCKQMKYNLEGKFRDSSVKHTV